MENVMQKIREVYPGLSSAKKSAASYFLNYYLKLPFCTVTELADVIGVSDTTIINLCVDLGFDGFSSFKKAVRDEIQREQSIAPYGENDESVGTKEAIDAFVKRVIENINQTMSDKQNRKVIEKTAELLSTAKRIYTVGFWSFAGQAQELALGLRRSGFDAQAIYPSFGDYIDKVLHIEKDDVVIMFDFARYISGLTEIAVLLKEKKVPLVLITDMGPCPRQSYADHVIHCRTTMPEGRYGGPVVKTVVNAISILLRKQTENKYKEYETVREGVFTRFNQYGVVEPGEKYTERV